MDEVLKRLSDEFIKIENETPTEKRMRKLGLTVIKGGKDETMD